MKKLSLLAADLIMSASLIAYATATDHSRNDKNSKDSSVAKTEPTASCTEVISSDPANRPPECCITSSPPCK